jgi:desulfoferrodoxin-like iron-binding protein
MSETGKRYVCSTCGSELLVTRGGEGALNCCGQPMQIRGVSGAPSEPAQKKEG